MTIEQEPKYKFENGRVINRHSNEAIPLDEPVFVFRARDVHAVKILREYYCLIKDQVHEDAVDKRICDFEDFARQFPERMKEPDTETE